MERIKIICIDDVNFDEVIDEFDIDKAHCFDPTEEKKLRHILLKIVKKEEIYKFISYLKGLSSAGRVYYVKEYTYIYSSEDTAYKEKRITLEKYERLDK